MDGIIQGAKDNALVCVPAIIPIHGSPYYSGQTIELYGGLFLFRPFELDYAEEEEAEQLLAILDQQ